MKPALAHHTPSRLEVDRKELFRWDASSVDQFVLVDPREQGWKLVFIPKKGNVPAHMSLRAPSVWEDSAGPVFVVARPSLEPDHVVHSFHDIPAYGMAGNVDRYAGPEDFMATTRERRTNKKGKSRGGLSVFISESGVTEELLEMKENIGELSYTVSRCDSGLITVLGYPHALLHADEHQSDDANRAGFMVFLEKKGTYGGEEVRIFDYFVERVR